MLKIVTPDIYTGYYNLLKSIVDHPPDILQDLFQGSTYCSASYRGYNAVGAKIITSVLYLNGGTGMQALIHCFKSKNISGIAVGMDHLSFKVGVHQRYYLALALIVHHIGNLLIGLQLFLVIVGHTAGHHHQSCRIFPGCLVDGIT